MPTAYISDTAFTRAPNLLSFQSVENYHSLQSQLYQTSSLLSREESLLFPPLLSLTPEIHWVFSLVTGQDSSLMCAQQSQNNTPGGQLLKLLGQN